MMRDVAEFQVIGHVASVNARERVIYVRVAINSLRNDRANPEGPPTEVASYFDVRVFDEKQRKYVGDHVKKGYLVRFVGRLQTTKSEKDGQTTYGVELVSSGVATLQKKEKKDEVEAPLDGSPTDADEQAIEAEPF